MSQKTDQSYLLGQQYRDTSNLGARMALHERFSTNPYPWHRWVFDRLALTPDARVLELGCGLGRLWLENLDRIPAGWSVTLTDLSPGMIQAARENLGEGHGNFGYEVVDAQAIPFPDHGFDAVVANHMLYHVPDRSSALLEISRVLKPGGNAYIATNGAAHMRELDELLARFDPHIPMGASESAFKLENGRSELETVFRQVELHRYESRLEVTEAEPLIAYVLSTTAGDVLLGEKLARFTDFVWAELRSHGAIHITKESGLFEARTEVGASA